MRNKLLGVLACLMLGLGISPWSAVAWAQEPAASESSLPLDVSLGFRGVGEVWQDPFIIEHYRSSRFAGSGFASIGIMPWLMGEFEIGYMRQASNTGQLGVAPGALELVPVALSVHARRVTSNAEIYGGLGYVMAVFNETTTVSSVSGIKPGVELRGGVRIHTDLVQPTMWKGSSGGVQRVDMELMFARRQHQPFGTGQGFNFSAWRLGLGLVVRL